MAARVMANVRWKMVNIAATALKDGLDLTARLRWK